MRHVNKAVGKVLAIVGLFVSRRNWFVCVVVPAIAGQRWALGFMLGTHGRRGLLLGNRWVLNGGAK